MGSDNSTLVDTLNQMSSLILGTTSRGGASSIVASPQLASLIKTYQAQNDDYLQKALELKLNVKGKDYEFEVDAGLNDKTTPHEMINEINGVFYPLLLSQELEEMYVPPAVASYLKLLVQYKPNNLITKRTGIYLEGTISDNSMNDIKIYKMPTEVFKDDYTCVCLTKNKEWIKAKITNVVRY